jgi:hypothetical protein
MNLVVESRDAFLFAACCSYLDHLGAGPESAILALRPRDPDFALFCLARGKGSVTFEGKSIGYRIESSPDPVATESKPEKYRELVLEGDKAVVLDVVAHALKRHRERVTAPRGLSGRVGVMRFVWDDGSQCWDGGKLIPKRPLSTLFLPEGMSGNIVADVRDFLRPETRDTYAGLHVTPVRVFMLHGQSGSGKTSCIHCVASEIGYNLAVFNFQPHSTDEDLRTALRSLPPSSFLCLEDVDCAFDNRSTKGHHINFASILAALDGLYSTEPLTVFLTTNCMDALDVALKRRVDYSVMFGPATRKQCKSMFEAFFPAHPSEIFNTIWDTVKHHTFSTSVFQKYLVRSLPSKDPVGTLGAFADLVACAYGPSAPHRACMYA